MEHDVSKGKGPRTAHTLADLAGCLRGYAPKTPVAVASMKGLDEAGTTMARKVPVSMMRGAAKVAVDKARHGETTVITSRGTPVAKIVPIGDYDDIRWGRGGPMGPDEPVAVKGGVQDLVREGRR